MGTYSEYYENYTGPRLTSAMIYQGDEKVDITEIMVDLYTDNYNWGGKLWKYNEIFNNSKGKNIYCEFIDDTGRKHWFNTYVDNEEKYFNFPLATPFNQASK